ncbi:hypothetical protein EC973_004329 [Apophysomyces ossiformis]|uniref:PH domain-containing protein n=1 Tax=Apophysomyces ossiformis TaxID=679940 RepID=A0A8H7ELI3_9FUNG|nr:hypothetical protein EC973_004329 [Apophysomyces ossiformis]
MSSSPPKHSLSSPTSSGNTPAPVLPTPSSSTSASGRTPSPAAQLRVELEQQLAEKEKQLQESSSGIEKNVLVRQITQLREKLKEVDQQQQYQSMNHQQEHQQDQRLDSLSPATLEKLRHLERDLGSYRTNPLSPVLNGLRKEKLLGQREALPSPSTSTMLPPAHGHDSTPMLPLPPPPTGSTPTKRRSKVPNADRRNTDIEFATEIGQGLLIEVRKMQALLQEKEEQLRALEIQKADLERAAESMAKLLRQKEENEEKLKEETWNLELAKQELTISVTDLQQNLSKANSEQNKLAKQLNRLTTEVEHLRDREEKLTAAIDTMKTRHEHDMSVIRRQSAGLQREKADQAKQIEALTSELAIAKAQKRIARHSQTELRPTTNGEITDEQIPETSASAKEGSSPNTSPPPSPKQTPVRNQALEVETLKTSLAHAHRMVSNYRSNLHKEKTEKFELKKLLAESQETIEQLQNDPRLWVDAGPSANGTNDSGAAAASRRSKKPNKRRAPTRKTRGVSRRHRADGSIEDVSDEEHKHKDDSYSSLESAYESDTGGESDIEQSHLFGLPPSMSAGFTPLSSELSQSQIHSTVSGDSQINTDPLEPEDASALANEDNLTPRSLGDELGMALSTGSVDPSSSKPKHAQGSFKDAAFAVVGAITGAMSGSRASGIDSYTQTDQPILAEPVLTNEKRVKPDNIARKPDLEVVNITSIDIAPVDRHDAQIQSLAAETIHAEVQSDSSISADQAVQSEVFPVVHAEVQCDRVTTRDNETQWESAVDTKNQVTPSSEPTPIDISVQHEVPKTRDAEVQCVANSAGLTDAALQHGWIGEASNEKQEAQGSVVSGTDVGVQVAIHEEPSKPSLAGLLAAGAGVLGLGALAGKASKGGENADNEVIASTAKQPGDVHETEVKETAVSENTTSPDTPAASRNSSDVSKDGPTTSIVQKDDHAENETEGLANVKPSVSGEKDIMSKTDVSTVIDSPTDAKLYSQADVDAMVQAAVDAALSKTMPQDNSKVDGKSAPEMTKRHTCDMSSNLAKNGTVRKTNTPSLADLAARGSLRDDGSIRSNRDIAPPRPTSPPPSSLLSRVGHSPSLSSLDRSNTTGSTSSYNNKGKKAAIAGDFDRSSVRNAAGYIRPHEVYGRPDSTRPNGSELSLSTADLNGTNPSVSSFHGNGGSQDRSNFDSNVIAMITETMIGDWLWKYTRKPVGNGISENRHQRYFWIHPYTRTLYWSTQMPGVQSNETKAKSAFIEGVSVIPDNSTSPQGLPKLSLLIKTNNRLIKVTAPDMARHNAWFESLSYLLARAGADGSSSDVGRSIDSRFLTASVSSNPVSILRKPSIQRIQGIFRSTSTGRLRSSSSVQSSTSSRANQRHLEDDNDPLEDVRMCCNGKHHVSKLEKEHLNHPQYRKRRTRQQAPVSRLAN